MNRNCYRLVFNATLGMMVPVAETARRRGKSGSGKAAGGPALTLAAVLLAGVFGAGAAQAELPVQVTGAGFAGQGTTANYQVNGTQAYVNQVGNKSILNWQSFNVSAGHNVQFRQVDSLATQNLVQGANFTSLNRIHDINPSVIAGSISQAAGQKANVILVNSNGIAFMGGSQVNLNSFTASTLNIADSFILDSFLTNSTLTPQFEKALEGSEARGFIKVFENAKITASDQGRVMLIAPTVVNKGKVEAADGQVILAAGSKAYLRSASGQDSNVRGLLVEVDSTAALTDYNTDNTSAKDGVIDGQTVALTNVAEDKLGHVTNLGEISTPRGNITMIGYAVNQQGIARATTSVLANGSIYLLAKDEAVSSTTATRGGRATLAAGSVTQVAVDLSDLDGSQDGSAGARLEKISQVRVQGQDIRMAGGALIDAPSGEVTFIAQDNPGAASTNDPFSQPSSSSISDTARLHIADGAHINVAGLEHVQVSAARNSVEVELRGDELKDSPINQQGALRAQKVYVDINRALNNANAGKPTLIAKDSLESYQTRLTRTAAERSTVGGTVSLRSQGETILESGAVIDLSGGSVQYTAANLKTTLLTTGGKLVDIADADAETRYDGIATRYVRDYGRWNVKEIIDLGQSYRYDPGYIEGKDAGSMSVIGMKAMVMQADMLGRTTTGNLQREAGVQPLGAKLTLGSGSVSGDYKLNQQIEISSTAATLPAGFDFDDTLPAGLRDTLALNPSLAGKDKIARLEIFSNQAAEVREALRMPQGGSAAITAKNISIDADVTAQGGTLVFNAKDNSVNLNTVPLDVTVADGVSLLATGGWANDLPGAVGQSQEAALVNGGSITLSGVNVTLGQNSLLDVGGSGRVSSNGKIKNGNGGNVTLDAGGVLQLGGDVRGYALGKGGTLTLKSEKIHIGDVPDPSALSFDSGFFEHGGFANFNLVSTTSIDIADDTVLRPAVINRELLPTYALQSTGKNIEAFSRLVKRDDRVRQTANLSLVAASPADPVLGKIRLGDSASILADDKAKISFSASNRIDLLGTVRAAGGSVSAGVSGGSALFDPTSAVWVGSNAVLDVSGAARTYSDSRGLIQGDVLAGGSVSLAGNAYVVAQAGSLIRVSGAAAVGLDVPNESGGLGRNVGSDAGSLTISTTEGALLDGVIEARAGGAGNRGGAFDLTLQAGDVVARGINGAPTNERVLSLSPEIAEQTSGLAPGAAIPLEHNGNLSLSAQTLEAAGFDRMRFVSGDAIRFESDLDVGAARALPIRTLEFDAPRFETAGETAELSANAVRFANTAGLLVDPVAGPGTLAVNANLVEFSGNLTFSGMEKAHFNGEEIVRFSGRGGSDSTGTLKSAADLVFHGAVIAPATASQYKVEAPGRVVSFTRNTDTPIMPLSALGRLTIEAKDIVQGGNVWAPYGQISLKASNNLIFKNGSLTSVAADQGALLPYGRVESGRQWIYGSDSAGLEINDLSQKTIHTEAASLDMQPGAIVNLAGGGDLQAYEFTVGPGGSRDILADKNTYAILPGFKSGFAPSDAQEGFDRVSGEAVYLSGVAGLADGVYTLLPAHYALLPGAYAVKLDTGIKDVMPGQAYSRQDGVRIAAGYVTDTREGAPKDARWQGVQVMTHDQVRARSEFTLTRASDFFSDSRSRPQDAGRLSVNTSGSGANALKLDAVYEMAAGQGGRGAQVDISALKLAITSGTPAGLDPDAVVLDTGKLSALSADSLFIGGARSTSGDTTTLNVGAESVTLANGADHALQAGEILLAAKDTLTLKAGSAIDAQGEAGDAGAYATEGNGAFVRAASTTASFARTGTPDGSQGTLNGEADSTIIAADSITLDATRQTTFNGETKFQVGEGDAAHAVAGNLGVGATRVNFGAAPAAAEGITYSQAELDALDLKSLTLTSYSTFDLYGDVRVGQLDAAGKPVMKNLTLQGAGLAGIGNAGQTAQLNAQNLTLANPNNAASFTAGGALGTGNLNVTADTLALGAGNKAIQGFGAVSVTANELVATAGTGKLEIAAPAAFNVARISGERGADQTLASTGALAVVHRAADHALAPVTALGAKWALQGSSVDFDSHAELPSGSIKFTATAGDVLLGEHAQVDVAGRSVQFFDVAKPSWGGTAEFVSETGSVVLAGGSQVDVAAAAGGDAGSLIVRAANGTFSAADGSVSGAATQDAGGNRGEGARVAIDSGTLADFSALNSALNTGGFDGERKLRVRTGDVSIAASDVVKAGDIQIAVDAGKLDVAGELDASGEDAGRIGLFAKNDVNVLATAKLNARASGANEAGGDIEIGTREGRLDLAAGSTVDVSAGAGGEGGTLLLRVPRTANGVNVAALDSSIAGARSVAVEAVKVYSYTGNKTLSGTDLNTIKSDNDSFASHHAAIKSDLGMTDNPAFHVLSGVEIRSTGDLTLGSDWNLSTARAGGEAGVLTLAADGNLSINSNLSDGFNVATPLNGTAPATLLSGDSWSYRLVAGADSLAANPLAVKPGDQDVTLAADKLIRTGTGDIRIASGHDIKFGDNKSAIYTAGRLSGPLADFATPTGPSGAVNYAQFSQGGGDVSLAALGDITGENRSQQLYSNWLFRQGRLNDDGTYSVQPAWWVRFDQFQQGVGALSGGNVTLKAGGEVKNVSASTPTQARMASTTPDAGALVNTGGGNVRVEAGGDVLGGQYFADNGEIVIRSGGKVSSGQSVGSRSLYTILALGDAQATLDVHGDINIHAIINPHLVVQSSGAGSNVNVNNAANPLWSVFSTYGDDSAAALTSLVGEVNFHNAPGGSTTLASMTSASGAYKIPLNFTISSVNYNAARAFGVLPSTLALTALQGGVLFGGTTGVMRPSATGNLALLAADSVGIPAALNMSDMAAMPDAVFPAVNTNAFAPATLTAHAAQPVHAGDTNLVRVYAVTGDVTGATNKLNLTLPKAVRVKAGRDVNNLGISVQHANAEDVSQVEAGRDILFSSQSARSSNSYIWVAGSGKLEVTAGRNVDMGTSAGIVSRGNLDNAALSDDGADIHITAGVGAGGIDYDGTIGRLITKLEASEPDDVTLWLARWLTGDDSLSETGALMAVQAVAALDPEARKASVREFVHTALSTAGRDSLDAVSPYAADYARGYAALDLVFPGIGEKDTDGRFANFQGEVNLFASRILTERGGDIEFMAPGGDVIVGLANTPAALLATQVPGSGIGLTDSGVLGIAAIGEGDVKGFARDDVLVNQSRILTVGGGDVLLWSSEGDIDAGKGKKTATAVPPPLILVDSSGNVTQVLQGAASGSGIGALQPAGGTAGDVDLIAPKGTVNAGDAGIRASNLNIAAAVVLGADNISVSGTSSGTPVADTSAVTAASSGATNADGGVGDATAALSNNLSEVARAAEEMKKLFKPTFITAEVIGHGE